jgi:hypothetical protein
MKKTLELHLFVEGKHDIIFYQVFLDKYLRDFFGFKEIYYYPYAEKIMERKRLILLIKQNAKANYLICADLDAEFDEELRKKKIESLANTFEIEVETLAHRVFAVVVEIESWYLAGFDKDFYNKLGILEYYYENTEEITKGNFKKIVKSLRIDEVQFRDKLVRIYRNNYSIEEAKERNESFRKFLEKISIQVKRLS